MLRLLVFAAAALHAASSWSTYRASKADFKALEEGVSGALAVADSIFPEGIERIDFVLYDARSLYVYSRATDYPFKKIRKFREYQVYRVDHGGKPTAKDFARCSGIGRSEVTRLLRGKIAEQAFECAPWTTFESLQKQRRSIYQYREGYLASIVHEYGHQYQEQLNGAPDAVVQIDKMIVEVPPQVSRDSALREGFATYCELKASRKFYPAHLERLLKEVNLNDRQDDQYGHDTGLRAAARLFADEESARQSEDNKAKAARKTLSR